MPVTCRKCGCKLSEYVLDVEHPFCPECHAPVKLPPLPAAPVTENEAKPESSINPPTLEMTLTHPDGKTISGKFTDYGIKARVVIPMISEIQFDKIGIAAKSGKLLSKISIQCEDVSETSILRIIHMMNQKCKMGMVITAEKLQTDFLDVLDPVSNKRVLAQVSQKDIEDHGFGVTEGNTEANKLIQEAKDKAMKESAAMFTELQSGNPENPDNIKKDGDPLKIVQTATA
jgi:predicted amino acid-binding ACT domain protein